MTGGELDANRQRGVAMDLQDGTMVMCRGEERQWPPRRGGTSMEVGVEVSGGMGIGGATSGTEVRGGGGHLEEL